MRTPFFTPVLPLLSPLLLILFDYILKCRSIERHADILFYPFFLPLLLAALTPSYISL